MAEQLTFKRFQKINAERCNKCFAHGVAAWPPEMWALAIAGEAGELCNLVKKIVRGDFTLADKREEILKEVADVMTYCDLMMSHLEAQTSGELLKKFNEVSQRVGYPEVTEVIFSNIDEALAATDE